MKGGTSLHKNIGASAASPTLVVKTENCLYIYVCLVLTFSVYIHHAPFVRDAIFPYCMLHAQETRLAGQKG